VISVGTVAGLVLSSMLGLRDFSFSDYEVEAKPAVDLLLVGDLHGFFAALPGYGGGLLLQAPFAPLGNLIGPDHDLWAWRAQAIPGLLLLAALAASLGLRVARAAGGRRGLAFGAVTAALIAGSPFAILALQTGHAEEPLVAGLAVIAVLLAANGRLAWAGAVVGVAAVAKPWALIAVPVVLAAAADRRQLVREALACAVAGALLLAPLLLANGAERAASVSHSSTSGIFKPAQLFWFAGPPNPEWVGGDATTQRLFETNPAQAGWAQRLEPAWAARISHPLIVVVALALAGIVRWRRRGDLGGLRDDLLLLLAAVCWWRCLLDTWNVHYYALGGLLALAAWEARRGRLPVIAATATAMAWTTFQLLPESRITPDAHTALYLAWALPLGIGMVWRLGAPASARRAARVVIGPLAARLPTFAAALSPPTTAGAR